MAIEKQVDRLLKGAEGWNKWRQDYPEVKVDLREANLNGANLSKARLEKVDLRGAALLGADLKEADLREANLSEADLEKADLGTALLKGADLDRADLSEADLSQADLSQANLRRATLQRAWMWKANLKEADLRHAYLKEVNLSEAELIQAQLEEAKCRGALLDRANLVGANLRKADLSEAHLIRANLTKADLSEAILERTDLKETRLCGVNLTEANLSEADLKNADLSEAQLARAILLEADLNTAILKGADLSEILAGMTVLVNVDLSETRGLDEIRHVNLSYLGSETLRKSKGKITESFLRGCGLSDWEIESAKLHQPGLDHDRVTDIISKMHHLYHHVPIQYHSVFISYAKKDQGFAQKLHDDLQNNGVRCWLTPKDIRDGQKIYEQIDLAIQKNDRTLLLLSENSLESEWIKTEIAKMGLREVKEKRQIFYPIALAEFKKIRKWEYFDARTGKGSAREIRDFRDWNDEACYKPALEKLLKDLRTVE